MPLARSEACSGRENRPVEGALARSQSPDAPGSGAGAAQVGVYPLGMSATNSGVTPEPGSPREPFPSIPDEPGARR
jgi:hypothetical protein